MFSVSGLFESVEEAMRFSEDVERCARSRDQSRILLDYRMAIRKMDQHDYITYADRWTANRPPSGLRIAALYSTADAEKYRWIETFYQNRSIIYKIFDVMSEAEQWLKS